MIAKECRDWVKALADCAPQARSRNLSALFLALAGSGPPGRWEIGLESEETFSKVGFRFFGNETGALHKLLGIPRSGKPSPAGFPLISFDWDLSSDILGESFWFCAEPGGQASALRTAGGSLILVPRPFPGDLGRDKILSPVFSALSALSSVSDIVSEWELGPNGEKKPTDRWRLRFRDGPAWGSFCRLDIASPFAREAGALALLLLNRRVRELSFQGGAVRAWLGA